MSAKRTFYWIKLRDSFFSSDKVDFLMSQKDGANYIVLYQMLCLKTVNNDGVLGRQIGEVLIPYDADKITRDMKWFSKDTVVVALELYKKLGLIYVEKDNFYKLADFEDMVGCETTWAIQKREQRLKEKTDGGQLGGQCPLEIDIEKDIDKKEINKEKKHFVVPTIEEIKKYIKEHNYNVDPETFYNFYESKGWYVGKNKMKDWKKAVVVWHRKTIVNNNLRKEVVPSFYEDYKQGNFKEKPMTEEEKKEMEDIVNDLFK